jgi:hypothetical protein
MIIIEVRRDKTAIMAVTGINVSMGVINITDITVTKAIMDIIYIIGTTAKSDYSCTSTKCVGSDPDLSWTRVSGSTELACTGPRILAWGRESIFLCCSKRTLAFMTGGPWARTGA